MTDASAHEPPVGFELRFARAPQADTALLPLEVGPAANEARSEMLVLSELDLQLSFEGRGALREDVEDQTVAIEHARLQLELEVALLACTQRLAHEDQIGLRLFRERADLVDLTATDEKLGIRPFAPRLDFADDECAGGFRKGAEFLDFVVESTAGSGQCAIAGRVRRCAAGRATYLPGPGNGI